MSDLHTYVEIMQQRLEEQRKNNGNGKDFGRALMAIRDILNMMYA